MYWYSSVDRVAETFTINLIAKIENLDNGSPFSVAILFILIVKPTLSR